MASLFRGYHVATTFVVILSALISSVVASGFQFDPQYILAAKPTDVHITSSLIRFDSSSAYSVTLQRSDGTGVLGQTCSVVTSTTLKCTVTWPTAGDVVAMIKANSVTQVTSTMLYAYVQPSITNVFPATLPLSGGSVLRLTFSAAVTSYGKIIVRFQDSTSNINADSELTMAAADNGLVASGRSVFVPKFTNSTVAKVLLALNGKNFEDSGVTVNFNTKPKLKIGFIYLEDPSDFGWNFQHNVARLKLEEMFFGLIETFYIGHVPEWGANECDFCHEEPGWNATKNGGSWNDEPSDFFGTHRAAVIIKKWVEEEGVGMIIGTSFYYHWDMYHMARRYPKIPMVHASGWLTRPNFAVVFPKIYQARYLSGIATAAYIKKNNLPKKVGYVSAFPVGETVRAINAFKLGMEQIDPTIDVYLTWLLTWFNARKERLGTTRLLKYYNISAAAQHTDSREPQIVMSEFGKVGVGYNTDMLLTVGDSVLTSPVLVWAALYAPLVQKVLDGKPLNAANVWAGSEVGAWRLSEFSSKVPTDAALLIETEAAKFKKGIDKIFCKPNLTDNKGRLRNGPTNPAVNPVPWEANHLVPGTTCLTDSVINQVCQEYKGFDCAKFWLLEGIHDSCAPSTRMPNGIKGEGLDNGECFLGAMTIPDKCPDGTYLTLPGCTKVPPGSYSFDEKVLKCAKGYAAPNNGSLQCDPCAPGYSANTTGTVNCTACEPGTYAPRAGTTTCTQCSPGHFTDVFGEKECSWCEVGRYADKSGSKACTKCPGDLSTKNAGTISVTDCACPAGTYRDASSRTTCHQCPKGMSCAFASDAANFVNKTKRRLAVYEKAPTNVIPELLPNYYSSEVAPLSVYECLQMDACPGGAPGVCQNGRRGLVCSQCPEHEFLDSGACKDCKDIDKAPFFFIAIAFFFGMVFVYWMSNDTLIADASNALALSVSSGMLVTTIQLMGSFNTMKLPWPKTVENILNLGSFLVFDPDTITIVCVIGPRADARYALRVFIPYVLVLFIMFLFIASKVFCGGFGKGRALAWDWNKTLNTIGQVMQTLFIAFAAILATAFQCYTHPNGDQSVVAYPEILCGSEDHKPFVILASALAATVIAPFLALIIYGNLQAASSSLTIPSGHLVRFRFLVYRFRTDTWWWGIVVSIRQLLLAFAPMVQPDEPNAQIFFLLVVLIVYIAAAGFYWPWKCNELNLAETSYLLCIAFFVVAVGALTPKAGETTVFESIMVVMLFATGGILGLTVLVACIGVVCNGRSERFGWEYRGRDRERFKLAAELTGFCDIIGALNLHQITHMLGYMCSLDRLKVSQTLEVFYSLNTDVLKTSESFHPSRVCNVHSTKSSTIGKNATAPNGSGSNGSLNEHYWKEVRRSIAAAKRKDKENHVASDVDREAPPKEDAAGGTKEDETPPDTPRSLDGDVPREEFPATPRSAVGMFVCTTPRSSPRSSPRSFVDSSVRSSPRSFKDSPRDSSI